MKDTPIDKSFVGKYVCYLKATGSFTWGYIVDQGFVNTASGEREVFIVEDQLTCRVAESRFEVAAMQAVQRRLESGTAGTNYLPDGSRRMLPDYQRKDRKLLGEGSKDSKALVVATPEGRGLVPTLESEMGMTKSNGLAISQKVGSVKCRSGNTKDLMVRRFGYNTIVYKHSLNLETDIVDPDSKEYRGMTEEAMFHKAMNKKASDGSHDVRGLLT